MRRAAHQVLDDPKVLDDPLAVSIVGRENLETGDSTVSRSMRAFMVARSRYAEDQLAAAVAKGVRQYVVLGAGTGDRRLLTAIPLRICVCLKWTIRRHRPGSVINCMLVELRFRTDLRLSPSISRSRR